MTLTELFNELTIEPARLKDGELRNCPFCNGEAELQAYLNKYYVRCKRCGAQIYNNKADTTEVASLQWNLRLGR